MIKVIYFFKTYYGIEKENQEGLNIPRVLF